MTTTSETPALHSIFKYFLNIFTRVAKGIAVFAIPVLAWTGLWFLLLVFAPPSFHDSAASMTKIGMVAFTFLFKVFYWSAFWCFLFAVIRHYRNRKACGDQETTEDRAESTPAREDHPRMETPESRLNFDRDEKEQE